MARSLIIVRRTYTEWAAAPCSWTFTRATAEARLRGGSMSQTLVIGDLHLLSDGDPRPARALVRLLEAQRSAPVIFAGDTLDLAAERASTAPRAATCALSSSPELMAAL